MPEGDTIHQAARRLQPIVGSTVTELGGSHPELRQNRRRITGKQIVSVDATGKHLLIHFSGGWALRTHLGMTGRWDLYDAGERWRSSPGKARVIVETADLVAVCFAAPTVRLAPTALVEQDLAHLGPDLMDERPDFAEVSRRAMSTPGRRAAELLLDQQVMAGVGNEYKSEVLFLEGIHPEATGLDAAAIEALARRGHRLLRANRQPGPRSTTGSRRTTSWVYGRGGRPCRRCGTTVRTGQLHGRITYWCPQCQPAHHR